jgi:hypothetical protein
LNPIITPLKPLPARNLDRKLKLLLRLIHPMPPWRNLGPENLSDPTGIPPSISTELVDVVVGLSCSSVVILHREALFSSSWVAVEVGGDLAYNIDYDLLTQL